MREDRVAIYMRLSSADEDTGKGKDESNSIINQRGLIHGFLDQSEELSGIPRQEFIDDGYSGTNTNRPAFQNMIAQIREGRFTICISKDFSRMNRDYLEMGDYLECLFPFLRVRYISINDNYDSNDYLGTTGGLDVVMRNLVYDAYSKDLSYKVRSGKLQSAKKGRRISGSPCFGYMEDHVNRGMDIIDPEASRIVRKIFDAAINGMPPAKIADMLNQEAVPTPAQYYCMKHPDSKRFSGRSAKQPWNYLTVEPILTRYAYAGASVVMVRRVIAPCKDKRVVRPKDEWVIVPGMHEAIVTEEEFEKAQGAIQRRKHKAKQDAVFPLKSLMICGSCRRKLIRSSKPGNNRALFCKYTRDHNNKGGREIGRQREERLNQIVFNEIMNMIDLMEEKKKEHDTSSPLEELDGKLEKIRKDAEKIRDNIMKQYEEYVCERIGKAEFLSRKASMEEELETLDHEKSRLESEMRSCALDVNSELVKNCRTFRNEKELTYDMAHAFIDKIIVYPENIIDIKWKFQDCFTNYSDG